MAPSGATRKGKGFYEKTNKADQRAAFLQGQFATIVEAEFQRGTALQGLQLLEKERAALQTEYPTAAYDRRVDIASRLKSLETQASVLGPRVREEKVRARQQK